MDAEEWLSRLNLGALSNTAKLPALRVVIQNNLPINRAVFFDFFPNFITSNGNAYYAAVELLEPLSGAELLKFFDQVLRHNAPLVTVLRPLAKKFSEKLVISDMAAVFKKYTGAAGMREVANGFIFF